VALLVDVSCAHFAKNPFRGGGGGGNYIPQSYPQYPYYQQNALPQQAEGRGEPVRPLASPRRHNQPKEAEQPTPRSLDNASEIELPEEEETPQRELKPLPKPRRNTVS